MITRIRITPGKDNPIPPTVTTLPSRLMPSPASRLRSAIGFGRVPLAHRHRERLRWRGSGSYQVRPRLPTESAGQGFPAPGAGAGNATTRPLGCACSGPP